MSASEASAVTAIVFQLMGELDAYSQEAAHLTSARVDPEAYHRMRLHLDAMRPFALDVPAVSARWVELLIRHFELAHERWKLEAANQDAPGRVERASDEHDAAVRRLREQCVRILHAESAAQG
jgi:hypothetical protein